MTCMLLLNCALKLVEEIILYYDARSKKHKKHQISLYLLIVLLIKRHVSAYSEVIVRVNKC